MRASQIAGFAESMRSLKDRTDHSYDALARCLKVSRSALHRYCSGAVVPADYSIVVEFARQCEASPEELTELYQKWILAQAARQRAVARTEADAPAPGTGTGERPDTARGGTPDRQDPRWSVTAWPSAVVAAVLVAVALVTVALVAVALAVVMAATIQAASALAPLPGAPQDPSPRAIEASARATSPGLV